MTLQYQSGFGNHFSTEAVAGALPEGRNSPQRPAYGLYAEQLSGTAFTAPRDHNQRSWLYRMRPTAGHAVYQMAVDTGAQYPSALDANRMRWSPRDWPDYEVDFIDSLIPMLENGAPGDLSGVLFSTYAATHEIDRRAYFNADGEELFIPVEGRLRIETELGAIEIEPQEVAVVPRGVRYRVRLPDGKARGYLVENRGAPFRLPDLGPIGSNGLANARDFLTPLAWFEDRDEPFKLIQRFDRKLWIAELDHSPFDVVAWHGNLAPYKYDLRRFNTIGTVSYDHPDPSIFTVLTSPSAVPGTANADFVIFPPRWMVAEDTFRPPWFHRNVMSEAMGLIHGAYDAKAEGFAPGGISLHNMMSSHGPDVASWQGASAAELKPHKIEDTMAFMVETNRPWRATNFAVSSAQGGYDTVWNGFSKARLPE